MKKLITPLALLLASCSGSDEMHNSQWEDSDASELTLHEPGHHDGLDGDHDDEVEIPLSDVPQAALRAAQVAMPGIEFEEAEMETEDGQVVYCLEGEVDGKEYEIEVTASGEVLEVELDGDDEDDDEGEDHDD